jgi:CheY-like chemotaxis protein
MSARILVVDDEPDLEALVLQKFRQKIRDGAIEFLFAHDGVEALSKQTAASTWWSLTSICRRWMG